MKQWVACQNESWQLPKWHSVAVDMAAVGVLLGGFFGVWGLQFDVPVDRAAVGGLLDLGAHR